MDDISKRGDEIRVVVRAEAQAEHCYLTLASIRDAVIATDAVGHVIFLSRRAEALTRLATSRGRAQGHRRCLASH